MSSQEAIIKQDEKKTVSVMGVEIPKWAVKLVLVAVAVYALYYLYNNYSTQTVSISESVPITVPTVETITPAEVKAATGPSQ